MITHIAIRGVRSLREVAFDLPPFALLSAPNGAGLAAVADAIELLSRLASSDIASALGRARGGAESLFHRDERGRVAGSLWLAAEMLLEPEVRDDWGSQGDVRYTRMRYEAEIVREEGTGSGVRYGVRRELLTPVQRTDDPWSRRFIRGGRERRLPRLHTGRTAPFISTGVEGGVPTLYLHQDGRGGIMAGVAGGAERTVLCSVGSVEFPHAYAAREEMRRWRRFLLTAEGLGRSSNTLDRRVERDGGNLPAALLRATWESGEMPERTAALARICAPALESISPRDSRGTTGPDIDLRFADGAVVRWSEAPEHVQRAVVIAALLADPDAPSSILLDTPENGLDPLHARRLVRMIASGTSRLDEEDTEQLRQAIITTHSPDVVEEGARLRDGEEESEVQEMPHLLALLPGAEGSVMRRVRSGAQLALPFGGENDPGDALPLGDLLDTLRGRDAASYAGAAWRE